MSKSRELTLDDIADQRAYERERDEFRREVIATKKVRRVTVGPVITLTFENRLTMRFQIQEMARAEKMVSDEQIQHELDVYNRLLPSPGQLSATLFLELTSEAELRIGSGDAGEVVPSTPEEDHDARLTREETTAAVHYVRFGLTPEQVEAFARGPVTLAINHPHYPEGLPGVVLSDATRAELGSDLT